MRPDPSEETRALAEAMQRLHANEPGFRQALARAAPTVDALLREASAARLRLPGALLLAAGGATAALSDGWLRAAALAAAALGGWFVARWLMARRHLRRSWPGTPTDGR